MSSFRRADKRMRERLFVNTPTRQERPFRPLQVLFVGVVSMLLLGNVFSNWPMAVPHVLAAQSFAPAPGVTTYQQFVKLGRDSTYHGPVRQNLTAPATTGAATARAATSLKTSPKTVKSAEPAKMQPIKLALTGTQLTATQTGTALTQLGSDKRLEVQVPPGSLDASKAQVAGNTTSAGVVTTAGSGLTLQVTQHSGHTVGVSSVLGVYDLSFVDAQGHTVQGVNPRKAITLVYHYQPKELQSLGIDPGRVSLSWPTLIAAARKAKQPITDLVTLMINDPTNHTLTAQTTVLAGTFALTSLPTNQQAPKPHLASVQGNSGNLTYSYPIQMPPGPGGFNVPLAFNYSSSAPNERHSPLSPADFLGDGWSLGLGAITAESYPSSSADGAATWFFLSGPNGVSDRLVPDPNKIGSFFTEHISHEKIVGLNMSSTTDTPKCFHVFDTSGTYYEYGCTKDSLQYLVDSNGNQTSYRWDLNLIMPAREGPSQAERQIKISYFQDLSNDATGNTSVRDAVPAQIVYQTLPNLSSSTPNVVGTIDFQYRAPARPGSGSVPKGTSASWVTAYADSGNNYNCSTAPPDNAETTLRCDDPIDLDTNTKAPAVMSVFSLQTMTAYVDSDTANHPAYGYAFHYVDTPFVHVTDPITQEDEYGAGEHLLTSITPSVYQNGTAHTLKNISFSYTNVTPDTANSYYDSQQTADDGSTPYKISTSWQYLDYYVDLNTNIGETVTYKKAYSNTHGTPYVTDSNGVIIDDRHDPFYCVNHQNDSDTSKQCTGDYDHPDDQSWSVQVVTNREALGKDTGDPNVQHATYNYTYTLGTWGTYQADFGGSGPFCKPAGNPAPAGESDCVFDTFIRGPNGGSQDSDWQDFYHGEFRGFAKVYTTPPDGNLEVQTYYSPEAWGTPETDSYNYQSGSLIKDDRYWGTVEVDGQLVQETVNQYSGNADYLPSGSSAYSGACTDTSVSASYTPCEVVVVFSKTTTYEQNGKATSNAPSKQTSYTYDDYNPSGGLKSTGYHNKLSEQVTSSNAPTVTKKWTYVTSDFKDSANNYFYYTVNTVSHSEIDDASGHIWQCQDTSYDEGVSGISTPAAGWPTTIKIYSNCNGTASASQTFTTYTAYDLYSNVVGTVDPFGAANSSIYGSKGCVLSTAPVALSPAWTAGHYTSCSVYDAYGVQATSQSNALGQTNSVAFDDNQGRLPTSATDVNGQTTSVSYSIDSNQNQTLQVKQPGETGNFTSQSSTNSTCVFSSTRPCYEIDGFSSLYPNAVSRTFYDSLGRATETRTPLDASHDLVTFTVYNEWNDSKFESQPFRVASGSNWIDPNGATDDQGNTPTGTITITDPLGRVVATRDAIEGTSAEPGIPCNNVSGTWTTCVSFALGSPDPNSSALYDYAVSRDANNHRTVSFADALGRIRFVKTYSANGSINANITSVTETQYNALNEATSVIVTDAAPQSGQSVTSVTTTATYDDMGRLTGTNDPDRGSHSYSYDADSGILTDISGTRTLGVSYDLLGRVRCVQDAAPTTDGSGSCSSGSHPLVQNSYDTSLLQLSGTTNYITGRLGQSIATTYYPDGSSVSTTEQFEYDQRGRLIAGNEQLSVPSGWNVSTPLPTYQKHLSYNDDDQLTMTQTTVGGATGYTFTQVYDSTTGKLTGLSNNSTGAANLASLGYNVNGLISDINFMTTTGTVLANNHITYDGDLRPVGANATWQGGSGTTGTIFSTSRNYDPVGNVISAGLTHAAISGQSNSGGSEAQNFCYDELNRMVWAGNSGTQPGAGNGTCGSTTLGNTLQGAAYNNSYVYTHLGQIWQAPLGGTGSVQQDLYCNSSHPHQLTGVYPTGTTCSTTSGATAAYSASYDSWGNMTARTYKTVSATLSYDVLDHLVQWNSTDSSNAINNRQEWYAYDGSGNRVLRRSSSGGTTSITTYAFGLEEHSYGALGNTTGNTYYYTLSGRLIGQFDGTNTRCLLTDELGSVLATFSNTAGSAAVLANQAYGPYGNKQYSAGTMGTNKGYTGQYSDGTGLNYYGARYYDPVVGRFISADIIQGNEAGMDPYDYVGGNPETFNDPTGLAATNGSPGSISCFSSVLLPGSICGEGQLPNPLQGDNIGPDINASGSDLIGPGMPNIGNDLSGIANVLEKMIQQALQVVGQMQQELQNQVNKTQDTPAHPQATQPLIITNQGKVDNASAVAKVPAVKNVAANTGTGCGGLSFAADTQVSTPQGSQAISTLQVGDHVQAYDPTTRTVSTQTVLNVFINHDSDLIDVTLAMKPQGTTTTEGTNKPQQVAVKSHGSHVPTVTTEKVHTTQNHPWLTTKGWVTAGNLHLGDQVQQLDRKTATVVALKVILGSEDMYDLTVSNVHTFAVGSGQLVVYNSGCDSNGNPGAVEIAKDLWQKTLNEGGNLTSATLAVGVKNDGTLLVALNQRALEGKLANSGLRTLRDPAVEALQKVIQRYRGVLYVGPTNLVQSYAEDLPHAEDFIREAVKPGELAGIGAYPSEICVRCFIRLDETQHQATSYFVLNEGGE